MTIVLLRPTRRTVRFLPAVLMMLALAGCGDSVIVDNFDIPEPSPLPFPDTPDQLMANFQTTYEQMDFAKLFRLLHPDFECVLQQSTVNEFPDVGPTLDIMEELRIHERLFSKRDVTDPVGVLVPAIQVISFQTFARQGAWGAAPPTDQFPDAENALYDVVVLFNRGQTFSTLKVQGSLRFYVTHRDSTVGGVTKPYYQMLGQRDLTTDQKAMGQESSCWGSVMAIFR